MKIKPASQKGKVVVELGSRDVGLLNPMPLQIRRIVVPVDFSETAIKALKYAVAFATTFDAEVLLVHVTQVFSVPVELGYMPPDLVGTQRELVNSARAGLQKLCAAEIGARVRAQVQVREGVAWQEIVAAAQDTNADLIILATHGYTGVKHVLLGSVAERVVRLAPCPVLVVRERERDFVTPPPKARSHLTHSKQR
jgi:universal stress protein A